MVEKWGDEGIEGIDWMMKAFLCVFTFLLFPIFFLVWMNYHLSFVY